MVLIVGGSGTLGRLIAKRLLAEGIRVRVMSRIPAKSSDLKQAGAEIVEGDLLNPESLARACEGVNAVIAAAHSMVGRGRNASAHVDGEGHRRLIDIARSRDVGHFIYTSVFDFGPLFRAVPLFRIKFEVEEYLKASGLNYTILRPTAFMDFHAHVLIGEPVLNKGKVTLFGRGHRPRNFIAAEDVAQFAVLALKDPSLSRATIDLGGPENLSPLQVIRLYERRAGRQAKVTRLPVALARGLSAMARPFHAGVSQVLQTIVLAETIDQQFDARELGARYPIELTTLDAWIKHSGEKTVIKK